MSTKFSSKKGQINRFTFYDDGKHSHDWYDLKTGFMGSHRENTSSELKKWVGDATHSSFHTVYEKTSRNEEDSLEMAYSKSKKLDYSYKSNETKKKELGNELSENLLELGDKFTADKKKLDAVLERAEKAGLSDENMEKIRKMYNDSLGALQNQYRKEVYEKQQETQNALRELSNEQQAEASALDNMISELDRTISSMEAASLDASSATEDLSKEKQAALDEKAALDQQIADIQKGLSIQINIIGGQG